jgi:O-antigen/teichoic acid export membrane protein
MGIAGTIARNTVFNFIATSSNVLISFAVGIVLARILGTEQYGLYALLMWFLSFAVLAVNLGLGEMAKRFVAEAMGRQGAAESTGLVRLTLMIRGMAALVVCFLILAFSGFWANTFADPGDKIYFVLLAFTLLPNVLNFAFISIFQGFQKYEYSAYLILGSDPLRAILVIALAVLGFGIEELLVANIIAWAVGTFIGVFLLRRLIPLKVLLSPSPLEATARKRALKYALTMAGILGVNFFLLHQAEVFFVGLYLPVEEVGFYTLASKIPSMSATLVPSVFGLVILPAIAEQFGKGDMEKLKTIYLTSARYLMMLALPLAAGGIALASPIITLLYGADYAPAIVLVQILFLPFVITSINYATGAVIYGINQPAFLLKVGGLLALVNVGLSIWLIPEYGVVGAAIAGSVPRLFLLPIRARFVSKKIGATWPVWDTLKIVIASLIMGLVVFVLQSQLGTALSLALCLPLGVVLYIVTILALRVIGKKDVTILKSIQDSLPSTVRNRYSTLIRLVDSLAR